VKVGDLVTYEGGSAWYNPNSGSESMPVGVALKIYTHRQEYKEVKPLTRELVEVLWHNGKVVTHDTYEIEVVSESR